MMNNFAGIGLGLGTFLLVILVVVYIIVSILLPFFVLKIRNTIIDMKLQLTSIAKDINAMSSIQVENHRAAALAKKQSKTREVPTQEEAKRILKKRKQDLWLENERKRKLAEKYGISQDGEYYIYKETKYKNLQDAISFAKLQTT